MVKKVVTKVSPLTVDCRAWAVFAKRKLRQYGFRNVQFLYVVNVDGRRLGLGPYKLKDGRVYSPDAGNMWFHHYAVIADNRVWDEHYFPAGLSLEEYETRVFEYADVLHFNPMPEANGHKMD